MGGVDNHLLLMAAYSCRKPKWLWLFSPTSFILSKVNCQCKLLINSYLHLFININIWGVFKKCRDRSYLYRGRNEQWNFLFFFFFFLQNSSFGISQTFPIKFLIGWRTSKISIFTWWGNWLIKWLILTSKVISCKEVKESRSWLFIFLFLCHCFLRVFCS